MWKLFSATMQIYIYGGEMMPKKSNGLISSVVNLPPSIPNMEVEKDKWDRPYAKIQNDNGDWYKQTKQKNGKIKREIVSDH